MITETLPKGHIELQQLTVQSFIITLGHGGIQDHMEGAESLHMIHQQQEVNRVP